MNNNSNCVIDIDEIKQKCKKGNLRWSDHIFKRFVQRKINKPDVVCVLMGGEIIEQYPDDYPYPSCLILGFDSAGRCIHVVCGMGETELYLVTAYCPDVDEWSDDFKIRKEQK